MERGCYRIVGVHNLQVGSSSIAQKIGAYSFDEYLQLVRSFHGYASPGVLTGGFMVDLALRNLPHGILFDAICETNHCLPDAVQILTPCTIGNGWLKIMPFGKFALSLYEKYEGDGVRVSLDIAKLERWDEIKTWFFKLKPKKEQDNELLQEQIQTAGADICSLNRIQVLPQHLKKASLGKRGICPICQEAYPAGHGPRCRACQGDSPYRKPDKEEPASESFKKSP
jgi:formylmethanofuran dehydrogenase subunit E